MNLPIPFKRYPVRAWFALLPLFLFLWYTPHANFSVKVLTSAVVALILVGAVALIWRFRIFRWVLISFYVGSALFLVLPSRPVENPASLRASYCDALSSYVGTRYVWGGASYFGIDCSGFVQKGLEDGLVKKGLATLNPGLIREGIWLYWHRTTAKVLGQGHAGRAYLVETCPTLNALDYSTVLPGDLAVTQSGDHCMAYLGDKTWIAADPTEAKVTKFVIPEMKNAYFSTPMRIMRWKILGS